LASNNLIQKCNICKEALEFHDRTIRHEKKWYHAECYRSTIQEKTTTENRLSKKQLIVRATIVKPAEKIAKATVVKTTTSQPTKVAELEKPELIPRCGHCKKELEFHDRTIRYEKKWYHAECYKSTVQEQVVKDTIIKQTPIEKLEATKEKTKEVQKNKTKLVSDLKVARPKVKLDPVLFLIAGVLFVFIVWAPFTLVAGFSAGAMILGGFLVMYFRLQFFLG